MMYPTMKFNIILLLCGGCSSTLADAKCDSIPMQQWAGEPSRRTETLPKPVNLVIIQHTATPEADTNEECETILKSIRKFHIESFQFTDIGISFFICGNGKVYEGSGWSLVGAHTKNFNDKSIAISFIGNFQSKLPSTEALNSALNFINCGLHNEHLANDYKLVGHKQVTSTISPGETLQNEIINWPHWTKNV